MNWWEELTRLQQVLAYIAIPSTLIMLFQFIMSLLGLAQSDSAEGLDVDSDLADGNVEMDFDDSSVGDLFDEQPHDIINDHHFEATDDHQSVDSHDGAEALKLFTLRGLIAFFSIGGWTGIVAIEWGIPAPGAIALSFVAGWLALYFVAWSIRAALRLQQSGNIIIDNAVGNTGEVYIPIPPLKSGIGKINIIIQDRLSEVNAVTNIERTIKTGEKITVMGVESEGVLLVVPKNNPPEGVIIENEF